MKSENSLNQTWIRLVILLCVTSFASAWLGFILASKHGRQFQQNHAELQSALASEQDQVSLLREQTQQQVQSLTSHVARLEANMLRINALGGRLVKLADLDPQEFQFDSDPGMGGPLEAVAAIDIPAPGLVMDSLQKLEYLFDIRYQQMSQLHHIFSHRLGRESFKLAGIGKPVKQGWVSSYYGLRTDPFTGKKAWHRGVDIAGREGSQINAVASGVVTLAANKGAYGKTVEINHGNGYKTRYGHNKSLLVKKGDLIKKGEPIALMGKTGRATGPHVHFEVHKDGKSIDPGTLFDDLRRKS